MVIKLIEESSDGKKYDEEGRGRTSTSLLVKYEHEPLQIAGVFMLASKEKRVHERIL